MRLDHLGQPDAAYAIVEVFTAMLANGGQRTPDLGEQCNHSEGRGSHCLFGEIGETMNDQESIAKEGLTIFERNTESGRLSITAVLCGVDPDG
jgi:hypothetical protein